MARRRQHVEPSMFPFLSVLCAVIGVLVLYIVLILSTRVVAEDEKYRASEAHQRRPKPGRENVLEQGIDEPTYDELQAELSRLDQLLAARQSDRDRLRRKLAGLESLLEIKKTELLVPLTARPRPKPLAQPEPVAMVPAGGFQVHLKPVFVEVSASGYTVHPSQQKFPPLEVSETNGDRLDFEVDPALKEFLRKIDKQRRTEYLVFLIHPNGVACFDVMRIYLRMKHDQIRLGWEPFSRDWIVANRLDET